MKRFQWALVLIVCVAAVVVGQAVNATLLGTVTDASGAAVPSAKITITEINTGVSRSSQANGSGNYVFPDLPPGHYAVSVEQTGFKKQTRQNVTVDVNTSTRVDVQLQPGDITETIEVTAAPPLLQTDRADTGRKIDAVQTASMPLGTNRNFQSLVNLTPGTTRVSYQHSHFFNAADSLQTQVNGQPRMGNNLQLEGIDDNERTGLLQILIPPIEAIQTVDISTSNFDAELGRATGAVTNVIIKSGTNDYHGEVYEFFKNSDMNARNFFDPTVAKISYNYFGGTFGGPIIKNKMFFFGDYLKVFDHEANTNLQSIPTTDFRTGNLSGSSTTIYNPFTGDPTTGAGRTPFAGNQIPTNLINPISTSILNLVPQPNRPGFTNNYFAALPFHKDTDSFDVKIDDNPTDKDRVSGRFSFERPSIFQAPIFGSAGGPAQGAFQASGVQRTYSGGINYDHIFSPTLITEVRAGAAHYHNEAYPSDYGNKDSEALGIPGVNVSPFTSGMTGIDISGYSSPLIGYSASLPWVRAEANIDVVNNWTKIIGNHTIKWGGDLRRVRDDLLQEQTFSPRGIFQFRDGQTSIPGAKTSFSNDFASFLLDLPNLVGRDLNVYFPAYRAWQFFSFVQDKWVVTPKLTLDLGLRWEFYPPATPAFSGGFSNYNPENNSLVVAGVGDNPKNLGMTTYYHYFAPRFGAAYRLTDSTVIRAGFGISYMPFPDNNYAYNFPVKQNNEFDPVVTSYGPAILPNGHVATFQNGFPAPTPAVVPANGIITNPTASQQYFVVNLNFKQPYVEAWNFAVQQALPYHFTLDAAYVGNRGVDISSQPNINAGQIVGAGKAGQPEYASFGRTANTTLLFQGFSSNYNSLQVKVDRRFTNGFLLTTAYTWSKAMSFQQGDDGGLMFYIDQHRNYAPADYDHRQVFVQSYLYDLPFGRGKKWLNSGGLTSAVFGGWRVGGILTVQTGSPLNFTYSGSGLQAPSNGQTPNLVAPLQILHGVGLGDPWFSQSSFAAPDALTFGSVGRNLISGPGLFELDFSVFKTIPITERFNLELRGESFNLTNSPQFSNPDVTLGDANFGYITGASGGRVIQLGAKLSF